MHLSILQDTYAIPTQGRCSVLRIEHSISTEGPYRIDGQYLDHDDLRSIIDLRHMRTYVGGDMRVAPEAWGGPFGRAWTRMQADNTGPTAHHHWRFGLTQAAMQPLIDHLYTPIPDPEEHRPFYPDIRCPHDFLRMDSGFLHRAFRHDYGGGTFQIVRYTLPDQTWVDHAPDGQIAYVHEAAIFDAVLYNASIPPLPMHARTPTFPRHA